MAASSDRSRGLLSGFRALETGPRLASSVCSRLFAELGADVIKIEPPGGDPVRQRGPKTGDERAGGGVFFSQNLSKRGVDLDLADAGDRKIFDSLAREADIIISSWHPSDLGELQLTPSDLKAVNASAVIAYITPFGLTGPNSGYRGSDLVVFHSSGLAKTLIGPVVDPNSTPPVRAAGEQSEFVSGVAAACAAMFNLFQKEKSGTGNVLDISMQEALAFMDISGLAAPVFGQTGRPRKKVKSSGPNLTILPASDGYVAISPREERQWVQWLKVMGDPEWGSDPRFANRALREENADAIQELLSRWSSSRKKMDLFKIAQDSHVPCFPLMNPAEHLESEQLKQRGYFNEVEASEGKKYLLPGVPYRTIEGDAAKARPYALHKKSSDISWLPAQSKKLVPAGGAGSAVAELPLKGVRVTDLSWVIAGPTCTRYMSSMGAEVVKIETSSRPDPGRNGELHDVLGQAKSGITLNLKSPEGLDAIKKLIASSDVLVENFAPGVMDRLGLGWDELKKLQPGLVMVSASGTGQSGPTSHVVAYGTLLQVYTGFAGLNGYPGQDPTIGMAWADPLCGMLLAFSATAALRESKSTGVGRRVDFSMVEAMLSTMPGPLLEYQATGSGAQPTGNDDELFSPHGVYKCVGDDSWVAVAVAEQSEWRTLAKLIGAPSDAGDWEVATRRERSKEIDALIANWVESKEAPDAMREMQAAGVPASVSFAIADHIESDHLKERGFFGMLPDRNGKNRLMPTLPWQSESDAALQYGTPPALGGDTVKVLKHMLGYTDAEIEAMEASGALK